MVVAASHRSAQTGTVGSHRLEQGLFDRASRISDAASAPGGNVMEASFDFRNLFVLDLANNHQGSVEHGLEVIRRHAEAVCTNMACVRAIKFQFRDLDTFVHPSHARQSTNKHIPALPLDAVEPRGIRAAVRRGEAARALRHVHALRRDFRGHHRRDGLRPHQGGELLGQGLAAHRGRGRDQSAGGVLDRRARDRRRGQSRRVRRASGAESRADALRVHLSDAARGLQSAEHRHAAEALSEHLHRLVDP